MPCLKNKQHTQECSLELQCSKKSDIASMKTPKSASHQENAKPCPVAVHNTGEKESCDHVSIKMYNSWRPLGAQNEVSGSS